MAEGESNEQALTHRVFSVCHVLQSFLLLMNLLVLGHISFVAEVIEISCISLGVEFRDERSTLGSKSVPVNFSEVLVLIDFLDRSEALSLRGNAAAPG